jgi:hypothetical protein
MRFTAFTTIAILAPTIALGGCSLLHHSKPAPPPLPASPPPPVVVTQDTPLPPPAPSLPVKQGPAPLAYIVESAGIVRVVEVETGRTIGQVNATIGSIVSVDETAGVRVGKTVLMPGPLAGGRTYQIFVDHPGENIFRSEEVLPGR